MQINKQKTKSTIFPRNLSHLYLNGKNLEQVIDLKNSKNLKVIYLHDNKITQIKGFENLSNLTHLFLQWNNLSKIENLNNLFNLRKLYLNYNRIQKLENVGNLKKLKELHINCQVLQEGKEFEFDVDTVNGLSNNLEYINISKLNLQKLDAIKNLKKLQYLDASKNNFATIEDVAEPLSCLTRLESLILDGNPAQSDLHYRDKVINFVINLGKSVQESLDNRYITKNNRIFIKELEKRKKERQLRIARCDIIKSNTILKRREITDKDNTFQLINQEKSEESQLIYCRFSEDYTYLLYKPYRSIKKGDQKLHHNC